MLSESLRASTSALAVAASVCVVACQERPSDTAEAPTLLMNFEAAGGEDLFGAPFPGEHLRSEGGLRLEAFPTNDVIITNTLRDMLLEDADGFGTTSPIYFVTSESPDEALLPSPAASVEKDSTVFLVSVDEAAPDFGQRYPVEVEYRSSARAGGVDSMLSLLPVPGVVLQENTAYAAVVTTGLTTGDGVAFRAPAQWQLLRDGEPVPGLIGEAREAFDDALQQLEELGVPEESIAAMTTFRTGAPTWVLKQAVQQIAGEPWPEIRDLGLTETYDEYCVFEGRVDLVTYQAGKPPYLLSGGSWRFDGGELLAQGTETARVLITLPRTPAPPEGYPLAVFLRAGAGGDRPLVERGVRAEPAGSFTESGAGPGRGLAAAGYAGLSIDGPHGGLRNVSGGDEQVLVFNYANPRALRDNLRQSALEVTQHARLATRLEVDARDCDGIDEIVHFDPQHIAAMGHSMGASILPLAVATEPTFGAAVVSGASASFIENVVFKKSPFDVLEQASLLSGVSPGELLERHDPLLCLLQWAGEPADPAVYNSRLIDVSPRAARHVLMFQGVVDTYVPSPVANAFSLSAGLDLAGVALDEHVDFARQPLVPQLPLVRRQRVSLPASGNRSVGDQAVTAVVVQHAEDGIEDGHEVFFQVAGARRQYSEFLQTWLVGVPVVPRVD